MIKSRLRNRLGEKGLSYLMKIAIKSPKNLSDDDNYTYGLETYENYCAVNDNVHISYFKGFN